MSSKTHKQHRKETKNLNVTSRCVAIVFSPIDNGIKPVETENKTNGERAWNEKHIFCPKDVLEDFKLRNRNCYWNPALVDSVSSLAYVGFLEPYTVLVKGDDIHLENIRTAWGRRVLKDPVDFHIERIGDVNGIQMQVIPQTHFIPLPEALCLIIMDLNNNRVVATLDTVCEKLQLCYQGHNIPSNQLVYDTLGTLIRERKVFHTGFGYFVVTPDTFRLHADDQPPSPWSTAWTHLHPMYIPAAFCQPQKAPMRSISCQVTEIEKPVIGQNESGDSTEFGLPSSNAIQVDLPPPRLQRSMSLSMRRSRDSNKKEDGSDKGLKRSSSVKGRNENKGEITTKDTIEKADQKPEKMKAEKMSLFAKLFSRNKKKAPEPPKPEVEYATFSAQFPPPEWTWYQQQLEKHMRTETWVQQQIVKSGTWSHFQNMQQDIETDCHAVSERGTAPVTGCQPCANMITLKQETRPEKGNNPLTGSYPYTSVTSPVALKPETRLPEDGNFKREMKRHSGRNKARHKDKHREKPSMVISNKQSEKGFVPSPLSPELVANGAHGETPVYRSRLSSLPARLTPPGAIEQPHSDSVHPMFSSTPRWTGPYLEGWDESQIDTTVDQLHTEPTDPYMKRNSVRKSHKSKRKPHHEVKSTFNPTYQSEDISSEYHGRLPKKNSAIGVSRDSGVNCIGLESNKQHDIKAHKGKSHKHTRESFKETDLDFGKTVGQDGQMIGSDNHGAETHIYANVEICQPNASHKVSKRVIDRPPHIDKERPRRSASYRQYKAEKRRQNQNSVGHKSKLDGQDLSTFKKEINELCEENTDKLTIESVSSQGKRSHDSAKGGTCSSEISAGTVVNTKPAGAKTAKHKLVRDLIGEAHLGDSGFSSPRVSEMSSDSKKSENSYKDSQSKSDTVQSDFKNEIYSRISKKDPKRRNSDLGYINQGGRKNDSNLMREKQTLMCNNSKCVKPLNNSLGELDRISNDSVFGCITPDTLYENVKLDHEEVLNNMKYLHKEITVSSQNLNTPQADITNDTAESLDMKQPHVGQFKLEGDFHVVGVV